jgi:mono/diheme cytochrome c family protein
MTTKMKIYLTLLIFVSVLSFGLPSASAAQLTKAQKAELFLKGARLWPAYCGECHKARPGSQFSPADWDTIMMHMRSRANLTEDNAQAILQYLKAR